MTPIRRWPGLGLRLSFGGHLSLTAPELTVIVATVVGALLRLAWLDAQPLSADEQLHIAASRASDLWTLLLGVVGQSAAAPLDYVGTWAGLTLFDQPRVWPALLGTATIPLAYAAGRRWYGELVGALAAVLLAVAPLHIYYSQEAQSYALSALVVVLSVWAFRVGLDERRWWPFGVATALSLWSFYFAALVPLALVAIHRRGLFPLLLGIVAFLPWVLLAIPSQLAQTSLKAEGLSTVPTPQLVAQLVVPDIEASGLPWVVGVAVLAIAAGLVALGARRAWVPLLIVVLAVAVTGALTWLAGTSWSPRQVLFALPLLLLVMAVGAARLPRPAGLAVLAGWIALQVPFVDGVTGADAWQTPTPPPGVVRIEHDEADDFYTVIVHDGTTVREATSLGCELMDRELFAVYTESGRLLSSWIGC